MPGAADQPQDERDDHEHRQDAHPHSGLENASDDSAALERKGQRAKNHRSDGARSRDGHGPRSCTPHAKASRMVSSYDEAVTALYQAPHERFVAERQRLAAELKGKGDKQAAARVGKLSRPTVSAWAVNQLWWQARAAFEKLFETAEQLRAGQLGAGGAHRQALTKLSARAEQLLREHGHSTADATLRRITMTLSGLAAAGGFGPEPPGALSKDRAAPGFEAFGIGNSLPSVEPKAQEAALRQLQEAEEADAKQRDEEQTRAKRQAQDEADAQRSREAEQKRAREAALAEQKRAAETRARRAAEHRALQSALRDAQRELAAREKQRDALHQQLTASEREVAHARSALEHVEARLAALAKEAKEE